MKRLLAVRHVEFENLGIMEGIFKELEVEVKYLDTFKGKRLSDGEEGNFQFLIILGGYMGAYETDKYEFLNYEYELIETFLKAKKPILGICLGAQMLARALGARVYKGQNGKEIGWFPVKKVGNHPLFSHFPESIKVLHWHGDTFDIPEGAKRIFSSEKYENQGFVYEDRVVALQFHIEVNRKLLKPWISAYEEELKAEKINPETLLTGIDENEEKTLFETCKKFVEKFIT